ncbi:hypothetical protein OIU85_001496 [Salix viminalis]|uniref:Pentacotripeptide-repeat region of PRORP domain-containing protein n=1 Tax=Salix viminalis TaxID=40686 RepID=A0A9Q0VLR9_SALVM|nr:hypothetical protein OIU85_001496 [Salix viminalis]
MIHVFVRSRRLSDAQALILRMIRRSGVSRVEVVEALVSSTCGNCGTNNLVFDLLIRTYVQARKLREGTEAFRILRSKAYFVSINACNSLLGGLVKIGWIELAWEVHREIVKSGIELNDILEEAFEIMNSMADKGLKPSLFTYNAIINGLCKKGRYARAKEILIEMLNVGLSPDTTTYNTLLVESCRRDNLSEAEQIFGEMLRQGVAPDLVSFSSLIAVFSRSRHLDQALVYFRDMKKFGLVPDNVTYTVLMHGYCRNGNVLEALKIRDEMLEQGCAMNPGQLESSVSWRYEGLLNHLSTFAYVLFHDELLERDGIPDSITQGFVSTYLASSSSLHVKQTLRSQGSPESSWAREKEVKILVLNGKGLPVGLMPRGEEASAADPSGRPGSVCKLPITFSTRLVWNNEIPMSGPAQSRVLSHLEFGKSTKSSFLYFLQYSF